MFEVINPSVNQLRMGTMQPHVHVDETLAGDGLKEWLWVMGRSSACFMRGHANAQAELEQQLGTKFDGITVMTTVFTMATPSMLSKNVWLILGVTSRKSSW